MDWNNQPRVRRLENQKKIRTNQCLLYYRHLLADLPREDLTQFYNWMTQQFHHTLISGRIGVNSRTPTWPPILFFRPGERVLDREPGVYFEYIPSLDFTERDLKYVFCPLLEYLRCLVSGCSAISVSYAHFLTSREHHPKHPAETDEETWFVLPSLTPLPDLGDVMCDFNCSRCRAWGLA